MKINCDSSPGLVWNSDDANSRAIIKTATRVKGIAEGKNGETETQG